jgi:hypothetical protein
MQDVRKKLQRGYKQTPSDEFTGRFFFKLLSVTLLKALSVSKVSLALRSAD